MIHRFFSKSALPPLSQQLAQTPISKFMTRNPYSVMKTTPVGIAIQTMLTHGISGLPVVDVSQVCIGLYTELDAMIQAASQPLDAPIRFRSPAISVQSDFTFKEVLLVMARRKLRRVPVVDDRKRLLGIVARRDMLKAFMDDVQR